MTSPATRTTSIDIPSTAVELRTASPRSAFAMTGWPSVTDARSTALAERPARSWELALKSDDVPGVDYEASFYVPVYARSRQAAGASARDTCG